jgi:DNA polymerase-3 subunit epsilon
VKDWLARLIGRRTALTRVRWVVIDCETSGLDPARDRLLSVGAVGVTDGRISLADAFSAVLAQDKASDASNILVHGIGGDAQFAGQPAGLVLGGLQRFVGQGVPVAFHAAFDRTVLRRSIAAAGVPALPSRWLDLAELAPALFPAHSVSLRSLDDWLAHFGIDAHARHDALGDAFATAQLLLVLLVQARRQGVGSAEALMDAARQRRWLSPA